MIVNVSEQFYIFWILLKKAYRRFYGIKKKGEERSRKERKNKMKGEIFKIERQEGYEIMIYKFNKIEVT
jgi:DNA polymerase elongation subunit (family B)